jgi:PAS domain S-box-containing protein
MTEPEPAGQNHRTLAPEAAPAGSSVPISDRFYRILVETVRDYAIFHLDPQGHIITWNAGARRLKGYEKKDIIGQHFSVFYPPEDIASGKPAHELVVAEAEGRFEDEDWRVRKDGSRFWANVIITALRNEEGKLIGFAKVTRDLTERRRAEEALRQSEQTFRLLVQNVVDYGIFMLDPMGRVASWNEGAERINGYTVDEISGRHFSAFYPAEDIAAGKPAHELRVAAEVGRFEDEGWRIRKDGTRFWANVIITALRNSANELIGFAKVTRDLTERRAAEQRAIADARRVAEIEAASRTKSEFLAALSHELRTPLNAIGGYADLLLMGVRGPVTQQQRQDLERIQHSQQHLLLIINDLLNFSRIEAGRIQYDIEPVTLASIIDAVSPMIEPQAALRGLDFIREPCASDLMVNADRVKSEQILLNLLSNAVKFTERGGQITVSCDCVGSTGRIRVTDTGVGIPLEKIDAVFEPFVQLGRSLTSAHEGTGLGLAISRDLARSMGGDLSAQSELGSGSTFSFTLPRFESNKTSKSEQPGAGH